jgi:hypothetical protein
MAYSAGDLRREIHRFINAYLDAKRPVKWAGLVTDILNQHPLPLIPDHDFNVICRRVAVGECAREVLRDLKLAADDPVKVAGAGTLPGFEHLNRGYPVERDDEVVIVPIDQMTRAERVERARQYRKMARGCIAHARELERYEPPATAASA